MSKFRKDDGKETPAISTSALPDIVFMLLFFFMVSTTMRETDLKVKIKLPEASELTKLEKKSLVSYVYIGEPKDEFHKAFGTEPRIQLNDQFGTAADIRSFIIAEREARDEAEAPLLTTSLKVDSYTKMKIVTDVKQELRKVNALRIVYSSRKGAAKD